MKIDQLIDALQEIDDTFIAEAADGLMDKQKVQKSHIIKWSSFAVAAAVLLLVTIVGLLPERTVGPSEEQPPSLVQEPEDLDLPKIAIVEHLADGMGYMAYEAYDFSELKNSNPWSEDMEIEYLPVYKNPWELDGMFTSPIRDEEAMWEELYRIAELLDIDTDNAVIKDSRVSPEDDSHLYISLETEAIRMEVDETMDVSIFFDEKVVIPNVEVTEGYENDYEDHLKMAEYLAEQYSFLLDMENPQIEVGGGGRSFSGTQNWWISIFEGAGDTIEERLVNYFFRNVNFSADNGQLSHIGFDEVTKADKVGDYPIISLEKAREKLAKGEYLTSVPYDMPGLDYVAGVELVYDTHILQDYYVPYYEFYVEIKQDSQEAANLGLKCYGVYLVPAVEEQYLYFTDNWDSGF